MVETLYHFLTESPQAYLLVFGVAAGDAVFPALPSETLLILGGVLASHGDLDLTWLIVLGALGAFVGDNTSYWIGRSGGGRLRRRLETRESFRKRFDWARARLRAGGGYIVALARFVPGGRVAVTFSAGALGMPWGRFAALSALGAVSWSVYSCLIGYFGGKVFADSEWKALVLAFGIAIAIGALIELARRRHGARQAA
jgi:membrane protein DedA with SNARE-associated domain